MENNDHNNICIAFSDNDEKFMGFAAEENGKCKNLSKVIEMRDLTRKN